MLLGKHAYQNKEGSVRPLFLFNVETTWRTLGTHRPYANEYALSDYLRKMDGVGALYFLETGVNPFPSLRPSILR